LSKVHECLFFDYFHAIVHVYRHLTTTHPTRSLVEMVPRQPDVDYEDSITTEQRAALWRKKVTRGSITNCVLTILVSKANNKAGKVGKILL
jgi:hypothetical protein